MCIIGFVVVVVVFGEHTHTHTNHSQWTFRAAHFNIWLDLVFDANNFEYCLVSVSAWRVRLLARSPILFGWWFFGGRRRRCDIVGSEHHCDIRLYSIMRGELKPGSLVVYVDVKSIFFVRAHRMRSMSCGQPTPTPTPPPHVVRVHKNI